MKNLPVIQVVVIPVVCDDSWETALAQVLTPCGHAECCEIPLPILVVLAARLEDQLQQAALDGTVRLN